MIAATSILFIVIMLILIWVGVRPYDPFDQP